MVISKITLTKPVSYYEEKTTTTTRRKGGPTRFRRFLNSKRRGACSPRVFFCLEGWSSVPRLLDEQRSSLHQ